MKTRLTFFLFLFMLSCGLKVTNEINENVVSGNWKLSEIKCYRQSNLKDFLEKYQILGNLGIEVILDMSGKYVQYSVETDSCTSTATAEYKSEFNGTWSGVLDIVEVVSGNICNESIAYTGNGGGGGNATVKFAMVPTASKDLVWEVSEDRDTMYLQFFTSFKGSSDVALCSENCTCLGEYLKIN